jgi:prophage regulatory protein
MAAKRPLARLSGPLGYFGLPISYPPRSELVKRGRRLGLYGDRLSLWRLPDAPPNVSQGIAEIAEMLGVTKRTAYRYIERLDFPPPLGRVSAGPIWLRADVEAWAKTHLPLPPGRPRKPGA